MVNDLLASDQNDVFLVVLLDLSKAFKNVSLVKEPAFLWLRSYLTDCYQFLDLNVTILHVIN